MIPEIEQTTVDGVTVLRSASTTGRNTAALMFRVGRFDETLPTAGITHLVEHLTLSGHRKALYKFNAAVGGRFTRFVADGADAAQTTGFITAVCGGLAENYAEGLGKEKRILRAEAAARGSPGALGTCLGERYGARGPGLIAYEEYGLHRLGWEEIERWRRRWFVAANAVLWIHGDIPADLRIDLPAGPSPGEAARQPLELTLPAYLIAGRGGIGLSLVGRQSTVNHVALHILQERLTQVLRHERGLSYGVQASAETLDAALVHTWITADALPEQTSTVAHAMLTTFETLAAAGSTSEEVEDYVRRRHAVLESQAGHAGLLHQRAQNILSGRPARDPAETLRRAGELGNDAVGQAVADMLGQVIVAVPTAVPAVRGRMPQVPVWSDDTAQGTALRSLDSDATLTVGEDGVMLTFAPDRNVTVRFGAVAALLRWNDERQSLLAGDGYVLHIDPAEWPDGAAVLDRIGRRVDPGLVVAIDRPGPDRPGRPPRQQVPPGQGTSPGAPGAPGGPQGPALPAAQPGKRRGLTWWFGLKYRSFFAWLAVLVAIGLLDLVIGDPAFALFFLAAVLINVVVRVLRVRHYRTSRTRRR